MLNFRKLVCKPRVDDWSPLAKLYYADDSLNSVAAELDSLDGRRDQDRCNQLVSRLRQCQDRVLQIIEEMLAMLFPNENDRAPRDFRVKFPDDILHDNLPGQLWFGAECLAAGSNIIDHEIESDAIRPLAKTLTRHLDKLREMLKEQSLKNPTFYPEKLKKNLRIFDHLFAEFELNYVSAMVPVKSVRDFDSQLDVAVLFAETLMRVIKLGLITEEQIENCDPTVMITLPRLAIVTDLLRVLEHHEVVSLERALCSLDDGKLDKSVVLISGLSAPMETEPAVSKPDHCGNTLDTKCQNQELSPSSPANMSPRSHTPDTLDQIPGLSFDPLSPDDLAALSRASDDAKKLDSEEAEEKVSKTDSRCKTGYSDHSEGRSSDSLLSVESGDTECGATDVRISVGMGTMLDVCGQQASDPDFEITYSNLQSNSKDYVSKAQTRQSPSVYELRKKEEDAKKMVRSKFQSPDDLIHRLFVCIAGVADQLQTNYPSDLRSVLKMVLQPVEPIDVFEVSGLVARTEGNEEETGIEADETNTSISANPLAGVRWVPDEESSVCTGCEAPFTFVRRRHHCRNCGQIFCGRCSVNRHQLPDLGYDKPVRVCNQCFLYKLNPFTQTQSSGSSSTNSDTASNSTTSTSANCLPSDLESVY